MRVVEHFFADSVAESLRHVALDLTFCDDRVDNAPTINGDSKQNLSDKLASSKGIICPPAGVDPDIQQKPPEGGAMKVVPPPGSPGGDQRVQPK